MNQQQVLDALAGLTLFSDLDRPQLQAVAHTMSEESFPAGQRILRQGFSGGGFFVILDGEVSITPVRLAHSTVLSAAERAALERG